jgi:hypothetical protein
VSYAAIGLRRLCDLRLRQSARNSETPAKHRPVATDRSAFGPRLSHVPTFRRYPATEAVARMERSEVRGLLCSALQTRIALRSIRATLAANTAEGITLDRSNV